MQIFTKYYLLLFLFSLCCPGYRVKRLMTISHLWRSRASSVSACIFVKSCSTHFIQVFFGLTLGLLPSTSIQNTLPSSSVIDLLATYPYLLNVLTLIILITSDNSSLLTQSAKLVPVINHSYHSSITASDYCLKILR